ncbi:MAG: bifunctional diaminohydroxyphosphoribosylaminopyrimidine deaminase/5-amino-6-(5-phosphoribosylamino)uracil reductase RibD [Puniceicoccales bacterium]|nr:bifunctional diaminohydroxyphosphoribosylaminopyrimidine deaminase/5-amino-6-(5-phosphoribosylamino)uracil reductase RibD [Puniceicoccales bacterium]
MHKKSPDTFSQTNDAAIFMRHAIALARRAWGKTHPNPLVGALIVESGHIVAEGWHTRAGEAHAEIAALRALGRRPKPGSTLYVTLEPCCTHGRTGACTQAIIEAGISQVVAGAIDPFPAHAGRGFDILRAAGIALTTGICKAECEDLNLLFNHRMTHGGTPFIALKTATTLDGRIATRTGQSQWITGCEARADVMRWRRYFPAIATSSTTAIGDNPRLTSRIPGNAVEELCPLRFVFDRRLRLPKHPGLQLFTDNFHERTTIVTRANTPALAALSHESSRIWALPGEDDATFFQAFKARCVQENIDGVWVEGGGTFLGAWLKAGMADYLFHYTAPKILADADALPAFVGTARDALADALELHELHHTVLGADFLTRGKIITPAGTPEAPRQQDSPATGGKK